MVSWPQRPFYHFALFRPCEDKQTYRQKVSKNWSRLFHYNSHNFVNKFKFMAASIVPLPFLFPLLTNAFCNFQIMLLYKYTFFLFFLRNWKPFFFSFLFYCLSRFFFLAIILFASPTHLRTSFSIKFPNDKTIMKEYLLSYLALKWSQAFVMK